MARGDDLVLKVRGDASTVASDLKPATTALKGIETESAKAAKALSGVDKTVTPEIKLKAESIAFAKAEIARLREQMARDILIGADTKPAQREIAQLRAAVRSLEGKTVDIKVETSGLTAAKGKLDSMFGSLTSLSGGAFVGAITAAATAVGSLGAKFVSLAANAQTAALQMKFLVRDGGDATKVLSELREFGAASPFRFEELQKAANALLGFGVASRDVVDTVKNLGEVASATGAPIEELAQIYGRMVAKGKIQSDELVQFQQRGVPVMEALAKITGKTVDEVRQLAEQGKLGRREIEQLDEALGQAFSGSTAAQAETLNGQLSTLGDNLDLIGTKIGQQWVPAMTSLNRDLIAGTENTSALDFAISSLTRPVLLEALIQTADNIQALNDRFSLIDSERTVPTISAIGGAIEQTKKATQQAIGPASAWAATWDDVAKATKDANSAMEQAIANLGLINDDFLDVRQATANWNEALNKISEAMTADDWAAGIDVSTEAGRKNDAMLRDLAKSAGTLTEARLKDAKASGESTDAILADFASQKAAFVDTAVSLGVGRAEAQAYADAIFHIPNDKETAVKLAGAEAAEAELQRITRDREIHLQLVLQEQIIREQHAAGERATASSGVAVTPSSVGVGQVEVTVRPRLYIDSTPVSAAIYGDVVTTSARVARTAVGRGRL